MSFAQYSLHFDQELYIHKSNFCPAYNCQSGKSCHRFSIKKIHMRILIWVSDIFLNYIQILLITTINLTVYVTILTFGVNVAGVTGSTIRLLLATRNAISRFVPTSTPGQTFQSIQRWPRNPLIWLWTKVKLDTLGSMWINLALDGTLLWPQNMDCLHST